MIDVIRPTGSKRPRLAGLLLVFALGAPNRNWGQAPSPNAPLRLSLEEALGRSEPASEALGIARAAVRRAHGEELRSRSEYFPQLSSTLTYTRQLQSQFSGLSSTTVDTTTRPTSCDRFFAHPGLPIEARIDSLEQSLQCATSVNPLAGFSKLPFGRKNTYNLGLAFSQTLWSGGRIGGQVKASSAGRRSAEIGVTAAQAQVLLDVVGTYYDATLSDRLLAIAEATLAQADTTLHQTQLRREVGNQPEFDLLRARVARDNQRPIVIQRRTQRDLAYLRLKQSLHLPLNQPVELTTELGDTTFAGVPTLIKLLATVPDTAVDHRSPVRQASEAVRAQEGLVQAARSGQLPTVSLTSNYAQIAYPTSGLPASGDFLSDWSVAVAVRVPIFTGGRLKGERMSALANLDDARLRHRQSTELTSLDTRTALAQLEGAQATWVASQGTAGQASRAYQIADIRYREGISTQTELLDARLALEQAEANQAQASRELHVARVRVALLSDLPLGSLPAITPTSSTGNTASAAPAGSGNP